MCLNVGWGNRNYLERGQDRMAGLGKRHLTDGRMSQIPLSTTSGLGRRECPAPLSQLRLCWALAIWRELAHSAEENHLLRWFTAQLICSAKYSKMDCHKAWVAVCISIRIMYVMKKPCRFCPIVCVNDFSSHKKGGADGQLGVSETSTGWDQH